MVTQTHISLADALERYKTVYLPSRNLAPLTRRGYLSDITDLVRFLEAGGIGSPIEVGLHDLENYQAELDRRGLAGASRQRKVYAARSFFAFLAERKLIPNNPAEKLVPPAAEQYAPRVLTDAEYKRLQLVCAQSTDYAAVRDAAIVEVLLQTGIRLAELATLTVADVIIPDRIRPDGEPGAVRVFGKGRKERVITLNWKACKLVAAYLKTRPTSADQHLFLSKYRRGLKPRAIQVLVEKRLTAANIHGASVHSLRHTFGTHHVIKGTDLPVVRDMMGHTSLLTTEKYVHLAREVQRKQMQEHAL
jgi:site-specific recombinase XerD